MGTITHKEEVKMSNLATGSLVILKSGGPIMTVEKVYEAADGDVRVSCHWFDKSKSLSGTFRPEMLKEYNPEEDPFNLQF